MEDTIVVLRFTDLGHGGWEDADGFYLPKDGIVGIMVDALSGPTEAVFARPTESFRGQGARPTHEAERELVLGEVSRTLEPGVTIVIAEITDPDLGVLDAELAARRKRHPTSRARRLRRAPGGDERRYRWSPPRNGRTRRRQHSAAVATGTKNPSSQKATWLST
jgi:hypothetical protein